jgi:hypothetical protein
MPGDNTQKTQATNEPWAPAQPILKQGLNDAQGIYNSGKSFAPYTGSTVVPYSGQTTQAMGDITHRANAWQPTLDRNFETIARVAAQGGFNPIQQGVVDRLTGQATGQFNPNDNPAFQNVMQQALDSAGNAVNLNASAAGRYGSGIHQGVAGKTAGDIAGNLTNNEYNNWQNRRDAANSQLFNAGQQKQQNIWQNTNELQNAYQAGMAPAQSLMGIGGMNEDLAGRTLNDQLRVWQGQQDAPKNALQWLSAIGSGAGSLGGTQGTTAQGPKANPFGQVLGGLLGANSLFG